MFLTILYCVARLLSIFWGGAKCKRAEIIKSYCIFSQLLYNKRMLDSKNNTIVALSTPLGVGAICIVRLSGDDAVTIADKVFVSIKNKKPSEFEARKLELGTFKAKNFNEQILCVVFRAPFSFTGENLVEFQCHGGVKIAEGIIETLIDNGATMAGNGEFSKRAFLNGKLSLEKAEGMMDMINAESDAEIRAGYNLLDGELGKLAINSQKALIDVLSEVEVSFDYPEETIEYITRNNLSSRLTKIKTQIDALVKTGTAGKQITGGISLLILGEPNVGKSSLLNALTETDRAIVTNVAGTTRDTIEAPLEINGIKFKLIDTAGIHETRDLVERIGIDKAKSLIKSADLCLVMVDASKPEDEHDKSVKDLTKNAKRIIIGNKIDKLAQKTGFLQSADIYISTQNRGDIERLKTQIYELSADKNITNGLVVTNARHLDALKRASGHLENALQAIDTQTLDLVSIDLNLAYSALGEITGSTTGEDIIDAIFAKFCLGK